MAIFKSSGNEKHYFLLEILSISKRKLKGVCAISRHFCNQRTVQGKSSKFGAIAGNCFSFVCVAREQWCGKVYFVDLNLSEMGNEDRSILVLLRSLT